MIANAERGIAQVVLSCSGHKAELLVAQVHHQYVDLRRRLFPSSIEKEGRRCRPDAARCNPRDQSAFDSYC